MTVRSRARTSIASLTAVALGTAAGAMVSAPVAAADLPVKAPAQIVAMNWTGLYAGVNAGYSWSPDPTVSFTPNDPYSALLLSGNAGAGSPGTPLGPVSFGTHGASGGVQFGYNWQLNRNWLVGLETDFNGSGIRGNGTSTSIERTAPTILLNVNADQKISWFGTVRGRLGWLPTDSWQLYATGGFAYGQVKEDVVGTTTHTSTGGAATGSSGGFGSGCVLPPNNSTVTCFLGNSSRVAAGWTVGAGTEYAMSRNFSIKAEYMYVNLGGDSVNVVTTQANGGNALTSFTANYDRAQFHTVRVGLNYRF